ncbi:hypothetical protein [Helicobacter rodentium]|uniref:hypothetical protein n=1 Tax=Helicobacter rodentium TaxID=59617 RepID=UPI000AA53263|nr:hypothetical protein [Helicobacter rodentium]
MSCLRNTQHDFLQSLTMTYYHLVIASPTSVLANASVAIHNPIYRRLCNGGFKAI